MSIPNEAWYALGGLVVAWLAQRLKLPWPSHTRRLEDLRTIVRELLFEFLKPPAPVPTKTIDDDELRRRIQEIVRESGK